MIAAWRGIWLEILARFYEDISGQTLDEYDYIKFKLRPAHPHFAHLLDAIMAYCLRPIFYWIAFGVIFIIAPWAFVLEFLIWHYYIAAAAVFLVSAFIDYIFIYPYLKSKAAGMKDIS